MYILLNIFRRPKISDLSNLDNSPETSIFRFLAIK